MMRYSIFAITFNMLFIAGCYDHRKVEISANKERETYENPLMSGKLRMGDPFVLEWQDEYYLYGTNASSKGFKAWHSTDLVEWDSIGFVYQELSREKERSSFWAPEVFYYPRDSNFYMVYSSKDNDSSGLNIALAISDYPEGPFSDVARPWVPYEDWHRIDGHVFVDQDEKVYLYFDQVGVVGRPWDKPSTGYLYGKIFVVEISQDLQSMVGEPILCVEADVSWEHPQSMHSRCNEGSFVIGRGDYYYMTYSANHYSEPSYGIGYAIASNPLGPWSKGISNPILSTDTSIGFSGPGHSSMAWSPNEKELFLVYHAHADWKNPDGNRTVNIDRIEFDEEGQMQVKGPTNTAQPVPR